MLTIENIHKIVDKKIIIPHHPDWIGRVKDVYYMSDNTYVFQIQLNALNYVNNKEIKIVLDREKIPYPIVLKDCWELSYEEKPNQFIVDAMSKEDVRDMGKVIGVLGNLMDRILNR